jgi:hypothetical protein
MAEGQRLLRRPDAIEMGAAILALAKDFGER